MMQLSKLLLRKVRLQKVRRFKKVFSFVGRGYLFVYIFCQATDSYHHPRVKVMKLYYKIKY